MSATLVPAGCGGTGEVPQMPLTDVSQTPGAPSDPLRELITGIGAVAKLLAKSEVAADPEDPESVFWSFAGAKRASCRSMTSLSRVEG